MFSQLQGKRPVAMQNPQQSPMSQQQTRTISQRSQFSPQSTVQDKSSPPTSNQKQQPSQPFRPRSQMEALPPTNLPSPDASFTASQLRDFMALQQRLAWDPSMCHPMFFTDRVRKAPNGVVVGQGVGSGYVFEEGSRRKLEGDCRL